MLQRIQTLYLLAVLILLSVMAFFPMLEFESATQAHQLTIKGLQEILSDSPSILIERTWTLSLLLIIIPIITLITINIYKHRILQIRLTVFNTVLMLGFYALLLFYRYIFVEQLTSEAYFHWTVIFPAISVIFNILAIIAIGKDEALVKSLNRLR